MNTTDMTEDAIARQQSLYNTKVFSDVTINFGDLDEIRAHKSILSIGSAWFHARFIADPDMDQLDIEDTHRSEKERLIRYMYGFYVFSADGPSSIEKDIILLGLATSFEIPLLVQRAELGIENRLRLIRKNILHLNAPHWNAPACAKMLKLIYEAPMGDGNLRRLAAEAFRSHSESLAADNLFQEVLLKFPELATDLMTRPLVRVEAERSKKRKHG